MQCPKCRHVNPQRAEFCVRCHAPLTYTCPACHHVQIHGGTCDQCGVDFAKYAAMLVFQARDVASRSRERTKARASWLRQLLLLPLTGGISLVKHLLSRLRRD